MTNHIHFADNAEENAKLAHGNESTQVASPNRNEVGVCVRVCLYARFQRTWANIHAIYDVCMYVCIDKVEWHKEVVCQLKVLLLISN